MPLLNMATVDTALKPSSPVPLDTIPISPNKENKDHRMSSEDTAVDAGKSSNETVTVFHDAENFNVKHPLMSEWTLWFTKPPSGKVCFAEKKICPRLMC